MCVYVCTDRKLSGSTSESRYETEPDTADLSKPLNLTFLLSPDILISNTYHFVRGQLLAERQRKTEREGWG